jgi:MFS family permease
MGMRLLPSTRGLPRAYWFLFAGALLNRLGGFVLILLAFYLKEERHYSVEGAGFIIALYGAGSFASGPVGGTLADRIGRRRTMLFSQFSGALAMLALGAAREPIHVGIAAFVMGLLCDLRRPAINAAVSDLVPAEDRKRAYGLLYWAVNIGFAGSALLTGAVAKVSFQFVFVCDAATTALFGFIVLAGVPETMPSAPSGLERSGPFPYFDRVFMAYVGVCFVIILVFSQGFAPLPLDLAAHGIDPSTYGSLIAINGVLVVALQPLATERLARARPDVVLAIAAALIGLGMGANAIARTPLTYAMGIVLWTAGEIAMAPVGPAVVADLSPASQRGAYQGAYQAAWGGSAFFAPLLGSFLLGRFGSYGLWGSCFAAGLVAAAGQLGIGTLVRRRLAAA